VKLNRILSVLLSVVLLALSVVVLTGCNSARAAANNPGSAYVAQHRKIHDQYKFVVDRFAGYEKQPDVRQSALDLWQSEEVLIRSAEKANGPTTAPAAIHH
jgi:outer membrane biogenesis lipoprotein LolB